MNPTKTLVFVIALLLLTTASAGAWMTYNLDQPIDELADNSAVDIIYDGTYVWLATGNGLSGTADGGVTWRTFNKQNSFAQSSVAALAALDGRLWAATAYEVEVSGGSFESWGGGLQYSDNFGNDWSLSTPDQLSSRGRLAYDLAPYDSSLWAACWYGGLLRSLDRGETWENIFIDAAVQEDFENNSLPQLDRGRYFSAVVDPYHDDSVIVWAGSAEGVQRLYYIGKSKKLASNRINDIEHDSLFWWYATDRGLSRFEDTLFQQNRITWTFVTYDTSDGFPGNFISAVGGRQELICAGVYDTLAESSLGLMVSTDGGTSWTPRTPTQAVGSGKMVEEIKVLNGIIWAACNDGGLIYSTDQGENWENLYFDDAHTELSDSRNIFHCIDLIRTEEFTRVLTGTDSGAVAFYYTATPMLDSTVYLEAWDNATAGQRVVSITSIFDDTYDEIWAAVLPLHTDVEDVAPPAVLRWTPADVPPGVPLWTPYLNSDKDFVPYDIDFFQLSSTVSLFVGHNSGLYSTIDFGGTWNTAEFHDQFTGRELIAPGTPILSVESGGGYFMAGSIDSGFARMFSPIVIWFIYQAHLDPLQFDLVGRSYSLDEPDSNQIGGNWIRALGLQRAGDSTIIWASTAPTPDAPDGHYGVSITSDRGANWREVAENYEVWNFAFNGDSVFLAATQGLFFSEDFGENWRELTIADPESGRSIDPLVWVLSARVIEGVIWVGTNDGIAYSSDGVNWNIFRSFYPIDANDEETQTYVSPNPYSPYNSDGNLKFHYLLEHGGDVKISVYDFANNLVNVVVDGVARDAGVQYDDLDTWDGRNLQGDVAAGGVYIYLIESSGGDELWGKFMLLP